MKSNRKGGQPAFGALSIVPTFSIEFYSADVVTLAKAVLAVQTGVQGRVVGAARIGPFVFLSFGAKDPKFRLKIYGIFSRVVVL